MRVFIDSNIPMYVASKVHPHRDPARRFLERVQRGEMEGCTSSEVLQEILYRHVGLRRTDLAVEVYDLFVSLCAFVLPVTLADTDRARGLVHEGTKASVRDAAHAAVMLNNDIGSIASFDRGFEHIPRIERVELA